MKRREMLRSIALTPLAGRVALSSSAPEANAATLYLEAIAKLPARSEADDALLKDVGQTPLDADAKSLVDRAAPALDLLRRGASIPNCDWGDRWTSKLFDDFPDVVSSVRKLARLATLRARFALRDKRERAGLDALIDTLTLGRHCAQGKVLIAHIVGVAIEHGAIEAIAVPLPRIERDNIPYLSSHLAELPGYISLCDIIAGEQAFFLGYVVSHENPKPTDADIKKYLKFSDRLAKACADPVSMNSFREEFKDNHDYTNLIDNLESARLYTIPYINVKRAMLRAAVVVVENGSTAVGRVLDPFDGKPFDLRTWATGFEVTSRFALPNKPKASLIVGVR